MNCHDCREPVREGEEIYVDIEEYEGPGDDHPDKVDEDGYLWKVVGLYLCHDCGKEYER